MLSFVWHSREWFLCAHDSNNCEPDEDFKEVFTAPQKDKEWRKSLSASANKLFYRASNLAEFDLESREQRLVSKAARPGCWINMIPAGGLLLVPEGSSGCICSYPVQASMAFGPRPTREKAPGPHNN